MTGARELGNETFPATAESVADARHWLSGLLGSAHPARDDAVLLLSEAFTNGVLHSAGGKIEVTVFAGDDSVRVEVVDPGGDTLPHYVDGRCEESGRGLPIMRALARDWSFGLIDLGRLKVWFEVFFADDRAT